MASTSDTCRPDRSPPPRLRAPRLDPPPIRARAIGSVRPARSRPASARARWTHATRVAVGLVAVLAVSASRGGAAVDAASDPAVLVIESGLVLPDVALGGRVAVRVDPVELAYVEGRLAPPREGEEVVAADGAVRRWEPLAAENGRFRDRRLVGGFFSATVEAPADGVWMLEASGHRDVRVNGVPRGGDVYDQGILHLPVQLRAGPNHLLFRGGRGSLRARLVAPRAEVFLQDRDAVLPDVVRGEDAPSLGAVIVTNATTEWVRGLSIAATLGPATAVTAIAPLPPCSVWRAPFGVPGVRARGWPGDRDEAALTVELVRGFGDRVDLAAHALRVRSPDEPHVRTFRSSIDESVQLYAVTPPARPVAGRPGLLLSLHGAGVQALRQAGSYSPKDDVYVVAPTNRRPFGFDWEDWGRIDALEVLDHASTRFGVDPARVWLSGHSMGGHGTWNLGASVPDRFAAIAPSAGWRDFWSYGGAPDWEDPTPIQAVLRRAANPSRTDLVLPNLAGRGVYVLHGDADDNVPVSQAREMRARLAAFHADFAYHERVGAGHWWGRACLDWPPLIEFLFARERPDDEATDAVELVVVSPAIAARRHWVRIEAQERSLEPSRVVARRAAATGVIDVETENVARMSLDLTSWSGATTNVEVRVDGAAIAFAPADGVAALERGDDGWRRAVAPAPGRTRKTPTRAGPFKEAFRGRVVFVIGTRGDDAADAWAFAKARFDAETFHYRGNGAIPIVRDVDFDPDAFVDRNVVLYGNADTNGAWSRVMDDEVEVREGRITVGGRELRGPGFGALVVRPRRDSEVASVAAVAGTGVAGRRVLESLPVFVSGAGFPDWMIVTPAMLRDGTGGLAGAGFFGPDWTCAGGTAAFADDAPAEAAAR